MAANRLARILVTGAVIVGTAFAGVGTAAAQTQSPPGFSDCAPLGGPLGNDFRDMPAVIGQKNGEVWAGLRGSYGPGTFGQQTGYSDKIVEDKARNRYIHARWRSDTNTWTRVGCKPKAPNEKPEDTPRFGGGAGTGANDLYLEIMQTRYVFAVLGGLTTHPLGPRYGEVGPVTPVQ